MRQAQSVLVIEIEDSAGRPARIETTISYFDPAPGGAWSVERIPPKMLGAFARGRTLVLRSADGAEIATFDLKGTAKARQSMQRASGF